MAKDALGSALSADIIREIVTEETRRNVLSAIKKNIRKGIDRIQERVFVFGCHFSNVPDLQPFTIGPVRFEHRAVWLARSHSEGKVSNVTLSRIERSWQGKKLRRRASSEDASLEKQILRTVDQGDFVCSVSIGRAGPEAGVAKALIAARASMASVALAFARPSRALKCMVLVRDEGRSHHAHIEFSSSGMSGWTSSRSFVPGGVRFLKEQEWRDMPIDFAEEFACAGKAIRGFTHGNTAAEKPKTMNALFQALLWFYEGATERADQMAVVKFCSSMEALTCGKRERGIIDLVQHNFAVSDVRQLKKDLRRLYGEGRSRTVHGTSDRLGYDWKSSRNFAELLAHGCLIGSLKRAVESCGTDDPSVFLRP